MADRTTDLRIRRSRAHRYLDEERLSAKSKFTGKEEDTEVGLTYFGARYYHARLGRFISADPLAVHTTRGDPNPYAYVRGRVFAATDPFGLDGKSTGTFTIPEVTIVGPSPAKTALQGARPVIIDAVSIAARAFGTSASTLSAFNMRQTQVTVSIIKSTLNASIPWRSTDDVVAKHIQNQTPMPGSAAAFAQGLGHGYMSKCASSSPIPIGRHVASDMGARIGTPPEDDVAGAIGTDIGNILPEAMAAAGGSVTTALDEAIAKQAIAGATAAAAEGVEAAGAGAASDARLFQAYRAELAAQEIKGAEAIGSALKADPYHRSASFVTDMAADGKVFSVGNRTGTVNLTQVLGEMNGVSGRFEWIVNGSGKLTHQMFVAGGRITGVPIVP